MATYRDPRIDYSVADAARELKDLVLELGLQRDKFNLQAKLRKEDREYAATVSMYQDAKKEASNAEAEYNKIEDSWRESGLSLNSLNEMFKTDTSLKVLKDINEIPAQDWKQRSEYWGDKASNLKRKADIIGDELFGDIRKAKNILAGGAGFAGGTDPNMWDPKDLGLEAYKTMYPEDEKTDLVKEFFDVNPGLMEASLGKLTKQQLDFMSVREKQGYYSRLGDKEARVKEIQKRNYIQKIISGNINSAKHLSGLKDVFTKKQGAEQIRDAWGGLEVSEEDQARILELEKESIDTAENIGRLYASLFGQTKLSSEDALGAYKDYERIHDLAKSTTAVREGVVSDPDFMPYWNSIERAYATWSEEKDSRIKAAMEQTAQKLFGFWGKFDEFYQETVKNKADYLMSPFKQDGQITLDDGNLPAEPGEPADSGTLLDDDAYYESLLNP